MDHPGYKQNRVALVCPRCFKVDKSLTTHLRRTCMRFSSLEEIHEVAHTAWRRLWDIAEKATVFNHREIQKLTSPAEFSAFLERKGFFIVNKPRETAEPIATPSTSAAASAPDRVELAPETGATHRLSCLRSEPMEDTTMLSFVTLEVVPPELAIENCELKFPSGTDLSHAVPAASVSEEEQGAAENIEITEHEHMDIDNPEEDQGLERAAKMNWTSEIRLKMKEAGLYNRHSVVGPTLKAFTDFLTHTLGVTRYNRRWKTWLGSLFYEPQDANLAFVKDIQRTNEFF
ncbi:uncharacterized protein LOC121401209 [Xenopus laevis]|uniref:Uncharacterized protein LOC121401209 n=1 Tax=Xenopus laevis TaxID=8355 RepID=A0A8J1MKA8_XENLA|nr:uncharacterized protein LOC121401209 [Xenopus laevis]